MEVRLSPASGGSGSSPPVAEADKQRRESERECSRPSGAPTMAYNARQRALRVCSAKRADGAPCRAFAVWEDPARRCWRHGGKRPLPTLTWREERGYSRKRRHAPTCRCGAFAWPHRPGSRGKGGDCRWPDGAAGHCVSRQGSRSGPRCAAQLKGEGITKRTARRRESGELPPHGPSPDPFEEQRRRHAAHVADLEWRMRRSRPY